MCDVSLSCPQMHSRVVNLTFWLKITHLWWCRCVCQVCLIISLGMLMHLCIFHLISGFWSPRNFWDAWGRYLKYLSIISFMWVFMCVGGICVWSICTCGILDFVLTCAARGGLDHSLQHSFESWLALHPRSRLVPSQWSPLSTFPISKAPVLRRMYRCDRLSLGW